MSRERLFVYGTLRTGSGHPMAAFLAARARGLGAAHCTGRVVDLGAYPGLLEEAGARTEGELWELAEPSAETLARLDDYEGCAEGLFERVRREVRTADGRSLAAWVYLYRGPGSRFSGAGGEPKTRG
ncbi:MAG: gamma-glutamylcyclotransferase [Planctomycetes bacterium]|nr:gamma-glutamylcyclotransferase [Planctomycetota bacterium]